MPQNNHKLLESVVQITGERDRNSLIKVLVEILSDLIGCDAVIFLRVPRDAKSEYLEVSAAMPEDAEQDQFNVVPHEYGSKRIEQDKSITCCINKMGICEEEFNGRLRVLYPIIVNNVVTGILDVYGFERDENVDKFISSFIRIYSNFISIIDDNEHDTLTGLLNRKTFDAQLSALLVAAKEKNNTPTTEGDRRTKQDNTYHWAGMLDIDHFKSINDNFGQVYGDEVLLIFSDIMKNSFRSDDLLFRYGGEEFVVVLAPTEEKYALQVLERFRTKLESYDFPQVGRVTVSIGAVSIDKQEHSVTVLENADKALYYAKEHGRNQTCNYHELIRTGKLEARETQSDIELF